MDLLKVLKKVNQQKIHSRKLTWQWKTLFSIGNTSSNRGISVAMLVFVGVIQPNSKGCSSCFTKTRLILPNQKKDMVNISHPMSKVLKISNSINSSLFDSRRLVCFFGMLRSCGRLGSVVKFKIFKDLHLEGTKKTSSHLWTDLKESGYRKNDFEVDYLNSFIKCSKQN